MVDRKRAGLLAAAAAAGAVAGQYFLDPVLGRTRRARSRDRLMAMVRRPVRRMEEQAGKKAQLVRDRAKGAVREITRTPDDEWPENDQVLADKVRSEALGADWSRYPINVDAVRGVVTLRGRVDRPDEVDEIERLVRKVVGVRDVVNLLHLPGTVPANSGPRAEP